MADTFHMVFPNAFSCQKIYKFRLRFHRSLFSMVHLTISQHWSRQCLGIGQVTSLYLNQWWLMYWRMCASLGLNELNFSIYYTVGSVVLQCCAAWILRYIKTHLSMTIHSWWRHQMETFSALLAICAGNSPVTGEFPAQRPVTWSFDVFFDLRLNQRLSKQSWGWWFETPSCRHCNVLN